MIQSLGTELRSWVTLSVIWPLALWGMLWLNLSSGSTDQVFNPDSLTSFAHGLRAISPFIAAAFAAGIVAYQVIRQLPVRFVWINPLTFSVLYGLVGLLSLVQSADASAALYWTLLYLSVPWVLLVISWQRDGLAHVVRVVNVTWLLMIAASIFLFIVGLVELNLLDTFRDPSQFLHCRAANWSEWSSGRLRATGVGRYAAVAGLLAMSGLWHRKWRGPWAFVFVISVTLLLFTGARGAFGGFVFGSLIVVLLHSGKKAVIVGAAATVILLPVFIVTGTHETFLDECVFRTAPSQTVLETEVPLTEPTTPDAQPSNDSVPGQPSNTPQQEPSNDSVPGQPSNTPQQKPVDPNKAVTHSFYEFTGRTAVWSQGMVLFRSSPIIGNGFHAGRIELNTHLHNAIVHSLVQTGILGTMAFLGAALYGWFLLYRVSRNLVGLSLAHKHLVIQSGAVLAFLTMRAFPESSGAFFGVDWLLLAPVLIYLYLVNSRYFASERL